MKKIALLTVLAVALATTVHAGWLRTYGGSEWDEGRCVHVTNNGHYIVAGMTGDTPWFFKTDTLGDVLWAHTSVGGNWAEQTGDGGYVLSGVPDLSKTDSLGDTLWTRDYGIYSRCVRTTSDGGYIITGATVGFPELLVLIKTNSYGDSLWRHTYILEEWVFSWGDFVEPTKDGGYVVAGFIGDTLDQEHAKQAFWLIKVDSLGDTVWSYIQGGDEWDTYDDGRCVKETTNGEYIGLANFGLLRFNQDGDTLWVRNYTDGSCVQEKLNEGYVLTGDLGIFLSSLHFVASAGDIWLMSTDDIGNSLWKRNYNTGAANWVSQTPDGGFIVTGQKDGDLLLLRTDSLGLLGVQENPIVESDNGWNVPHSIGSHIVLHYENLPQGFNAKVFDVSGRQVDQIHGDGNEGAMTWGINQPPGVYFIQALNNRNQLKTAKVVLVR